MKKLFFLPFFTLFLAACGAPSSSPSASLGDICTENGGKWDAQYSECENISPNICEENGGIFQECASACRHNTDKNAPCTMQCVLVCGFEDAAPEVEEKKEKIGDARNTSYALNNQVFTLVDGISETPSAPDSASKNIVQIFSDIPKGDFDGNGKEDAAVILTQETGGTGTFFYFTVFNGEKAFNTFLLGDRIALEGVVFQDGMLTVNYAKRKSGESFAEQPSVGASRYFILRDNVLLEVSHQEK